MKVIVPFLLIQAAGISLWAYIVLHFSSQPTVSFPPETIQTNHGKCLLREYGNNRKVCVCNEHTCDTIEPPKRIEQGSYWKYTSNKDGLRFEKTLENFSNPLEVNGMKKKIIVRSEEGFQKILGFGGAFTDSAGINIMSLNENVRNKLMMSYFSEEGIEYNFGRVPMASTDMSARSYSYHDDEDVTLANFSLATEDYEYRIPLLHSARKLTKNKLKLLTSTWIAPKWMKENGLYTPGTLKESMHQVWADYFLKFLDAYAAENITFWGMSSGNEIVAGLFPGVAVPLVGWHSKTMMKWLRDNLGPTIKNSSHSHIKIIIFDDMRVFLPQYAKKIFADSKAREYTDGIATHWYLDKAVTARILDKTHELYPDKFLMVSEASEGGFLSTPAELGLWKRAENYAANIIENLSHWSTAWIDWNMALDLQGGPSYALNFCDAPIIVNATGQEFFKQPMFYAIGHFSKFVPEDSRRIFVAGFDRNVPVIAFKRPDDGIVVVILNRVDVAVEVVIVDENKGSIPVTLTEHSITTIIYW